MNQPEYYVTGDGLPMISLFTSTRGKHVALLIAMLLVLHRMYIVQQKRAPPASACDRSEPTSDRRRDEGTFNFTADASEPLFQSSDLQPHHFSPILTEMRTNEHQNEDPGNTIRPALGWKIDAIGLRTRTIGTARPPTSNESGKQSQYRAVLAP